MTICQRTRQLFIHKNSRSVDQFFMHKQLINFVMHKNSLRWFINWFEKTGVGYQRHVLTMKATHH